eukprot:2858530-Amphidinium_carterae.1
MRLQGLGFECVLQQLLQRVRGPWSSWSGCNSTDPYNKIRKRHILSAGKSFTCWSAATCQQCIVAAAVCQVTRPAKHARAEQLNRNAVNLWCLRTASNGPACETHHMCLMSRCGRACNS